MQHGMPLPKVRLQPDRIGKEMYHPMAAFCRNVGKPSDHLDSQ